MATIQFDVKVHEEDGMLWAQVKQIPGCFASGEDLGELQEALMEAIQMCLPEGIGMTDARFIPDPDDPKPASAREPRHMLVRA